MKRAARRIAAAMVVYGCMHAHSCLASHPSLTECFEGSDFVGNAALSRENGVPATKFMERMQQDFTLIHAFPQELRWFVHDPEDELYLLGAARDVFERPAPPEEHRRTFLESCFARMAMSPFSDPAPPEPSHGDSTR
jgi:hypothetical protein